MSCWRACRMIQISQNFICLSIYLFIYLFINLFICTFVMKDLFDFDLCINVFSRRQVLRRAKKREMRHKQQSNSRFRFTFYFFFFFFFFYRRLRLFARKMNVSINKQSFIEHNVEQYIDNLFDFVKNILYSIRRLTFDVFSLNEKLKNRSKRLIEHVQIEIKFAKIAWLIHTIFDVFEFMNFDRVFKIRYNIIKKNLFKIIVNSERCDEFYKQTFHDVDDEKIEIAIRFQIEYHRATIEIESKNNKKMQNDSNWIFLKRFKKRKKWIMIDFLRKSFVYEFKLLKTSSINSIFLNKIRSYLINIIVFRFRLERKQLNNFNLSTLLKICEKKNHIAIFRSQHMYIVFKMIDIKANTFWNFIALYSNENHDMFRRCDQMIAIFAVQISCLTLRLFKLLQICDILFRFV